MAAGQTGDTIIRLKRSETVGNTPSGLTYGEPAVNIADQKLWVGDSSGANVLLFAGPSAEQPAGQDGQLNYMFNGGFSASNNLAFINDTLGVTGEFVITGRTHIGTGISCDGGATFANDVNVNNLTIGKGGGDVSNNTALGYRALYSNTEGEGNIASGREALFNNTEGDYNVASGYRALYSNTEGNYNVASGFQALYDNTEGDYNVASGYAALYSNIEGHFNVASGYAALYSNTEGGGNVASGYQALYSNTEGINNVASGRQALYGNTGGDNNVASGYGSGRSIVGSNNTAIGKDSGYDRFNDFTGNNNTYIGYNAQPSSATVSNEIVLGDSNVTLIHSVAGMSMGGGATFGGDVTIISAGDVALNLIADTDNVDENDNPIIRMGQDGGEGTFELGVVGSSGQIFTNSTGNAGFLNTGSGWNDLQFATNDAMRMTILRTGEVGIGTNAPTSALEIVGGMSASGGATFGGVVGITGSGNHIQFPDGTTQGTAYTQTEEIIGINVDNGSSVLTTGTKGHRVLPYDCEVTEWTVTSIGSAGDIQWDVNWVSYANWPNGLASVAGSDLPNIPASGKKNQDTSVGWTKTTFDAGDILQFEIDSVTTLTNCNLALKIRRTS